MMTSSISLDIPCWICPHWVTETWIFDWESL